MKFLFIFSYSIVKHPMSKYHKPACLNSSFTHPHGLINHKMLYCWVAYTTMQLRWYLLTKHREYCMIPNAIKANELTLIMDGLHMIRIHIYTGCIVCVRACVCVYFGGLVQDCNIWRCCSLALSQRLFQTSSPVFIFEMPLFISIYFCFRGVRVCAHHSLHKLK